MSITWKEYSVLYENELNINLLHGKNDQEQASLCDMVFETI